MTRFTKITALAGVVFAFGGSAAFAQSPAEQVYEPTQGVLDVVSSGTPTPTPTPAAETAPETATAPTTSKAPKQDTDTAAPATTPAPATETQQATTGQLPFTGFEAGFVALAGLALLGGGLAMRRSARDR